MTAHDSAGVPRCEGDFHRFAGAALICQCGKRFIGPAPSVTPTAEPREPEPKGALQEWAAQVFPNSRRMTPDEERAYRAAIMASAEPREAPTAEPISFPKLLDRFETALVMAKEAEREKDRDEWSEAAAKYETQILDTVAALRADLAAVRTECDAWEEWAEHQQWCAVCAESSPDDCTEHGGGDLKKRAHELRAARSSRDGEPTDTRAGHPEERAP